MSNLINYHILVGYHDKDYSNANEVYWSTNIPYDFTAVSCASVTYNPVWKNIQVVYAVSRYIVYILIGTNLQLNNLIFS